VDGPIGTAWQIAQAHGDWQGHTVHQKATDEAAPPSGARLAFGLAFLIAALPHENLPGQGFQGRPCRKKIRDTTGNHRMGELVPWGTLRRSEHKSKLVQR
jgi:hypothetical protein